MRMSQSKSVPTPLSKLFDRRQATANLVTQPEVPHYPVPEKEIIILQLNICYCKSKDAMNVFSQVACHDIHKVKKSYSKRRR